MLLKNLLLFTKLVLPAGSIASEIHATGQYSWIKKESLKMIFLKKQKSKEKCFLIYPFLILH